MSKVRSFPTENLQPKPFIMHTEKFLKGCDCNSKTGIQKIIDNYDGSKTYMWNCDCGKILKSRTELIHIISQNYDDADNIKIGAPLAESESERDPLSIEEITKNQATHVLHSLIKPINMNILHNFNEKYKDDAIEDIFEKLTVKHVEDKITLNFSSLGKIDLTKKKDDGDKKPTMADRQFIPTFKTDDKLKREKTYDGLPIYRVKIKKNIIN